MKDVRFTKNGIAALPLPASGNQVLYPDPEQPHHFVRVTTGGARSFVVDKNTKRGRIRITLGTAGTDFLTTAQSRDQARIALGLIAEGHTADQIRTRLDRSQDRIPSGAMTLNDVLEQYLIERRHKLAERTRRDYLSLMDTYLAAWKNTPLEAIDEAAIVAKFTAINSPSRANYSFRLVRLLFNYAKSIRDDEGKPIVAINPVAVLSQRRVWHTEKPRREVIDLAALKPWWAAVQQLEPGEAERTGDGRFAEGSAALNSNADAVRDFLVFLLLTGLRRNEAATLKWQDVDLHSKMFTVSVQTKNHEAHSLPLSDYLYSMLTRRHADPQRTAYVFAGENGPLGEPKKQIAKVVAASGVAFSSHTLRRTFASIAESLDIPYLALKRLLNHKAQDVTGKHYTVIGVERLRDPMQRITDFILRAAGERETAGVAEIKQNRVT